MLDGGDGLPCDADPVAEFALRHFEHHKAEHADVVGEGKFGHGSISTAVIIELRAYADEFGDDDGGLALSVARALSFECDVRAAGSGCEIRMAWPVADDLLGIE